MLNVYIGFDPREAVAFYTLAHSILERSFSMTRFLVPALSEYRGWSLYMDRDMLCRGDIPQGCFFAG